MKKYYVCGPSGAGKSYLENVLDIPVYDLDLVGHRTEHDTWKEWHIPTGVFALLSSAPWRHVAVGASSEPDELILAAQVAGYDVVCLAPPPAVVEANRKKRGDSAEKQSKSKENVESWLAIAYEHDLPVFDSVWGVQKHVSL